MDWHTVAALAPAD